MRGRPHAAPVFAGARDVLALVGVLGTVLLGCGPAPSASAGGSLVAEPASPAASGGGASSVASQPAPTVIPSLELAPVGISLELDPDGPFLGPEDGPPGARYVMPAAGTRDRDGNLVLVVVWFGDGGEPPTVTISTSTDDGATWDVGLDPILEGLQIGHPDPGPIPSAILQLEDGSWQMYGSAPANAGGRTFWSWRTSAPALAGPWSVDAVELLPAGPAGAWDSFMATIGPVQQVPDGFLAWFEGEPPGSSVRGEIGLATSPDGLDWTKLDDPATTEARVAESDPVISPAICGAASELAVEQPQVERLGDGWVALFGGFSATTDWLDVLAAVSLDGRVWQCATAVPLLSSASLDPGDGIHTMTSVPLADGRIGLILEVLEEDGSRLRWATVEVTD